MLETDYIVNSFAANVVRAADFCGCIFHQLTKSLKDVEEWKWRFGHLSYCVFYLFRHPRCMALSHFNHSAAEMLFIQPICLRPRCLPASLHYVELSGHHEALQKPDHGSLIRIMSVWGGTHSGLPGTSLVGNPELQFFYLHHYYEGKDVNHLICTYCFCLFFTDAKDVGLQQSGLFHAV